MYKVGEVVQLRSGGPNMTIFTVDEARKTVWTQWFVEGKVEHGEFAFDTLQKHQDCESKIF